MKFSVPIFLKEKKKKEEKKQLRAEMEQVISKKKKKRHSCIHVKKVWFGWNIWKYVKISAKNTCLFSLVTTP